jgi:hypothetical protein
MNPFSAVGRESMIESSELLLASLQLPGQGPFGSEGDEPVYALPVRAIDRLAGPNGRSGRRWLNATQSKAERAFARHCESLNCVGFQSHGSIVYHFLTRKSIDITNPFVAAIGLTELQLQTFGALDKQASKANLRLRGVTGWLLTEPAFLKEVNDVRDHYLRIPEDNRPRFPLGRILSFPRSMPHTETRFRTALVNLLDRWGLMSLATWGLPSPQGPMFPDYLPPGAPARPAHGIHIYIPTHYPLKGDDEIQTKIEEFQRQAVAGLAIDASLAGLAHFETYERMFQVLHLERSIRRRFLYSPRGLVDAIEAATAAEFHLSTERVKRLRSYIAQCLVGRRLQIKELRASH